MISFLSTFINAWFINEHDYIKKIEKVKKKDENVKVNKFFIVKSRLLIFLILNAFFDLDYLTEWLTRNHDIIFFLSFLIN
jgi:hypothetical protein